MELERRSNEGSMGLGSDVPRVPGPSEAIYEDFTVSASGPSYRRGLNAGLSALSAPARPGVDTPGRNESSRLDGEVGGEGSGQQLDPNDPKAAVPILQKIRDKVIRTVKARGINYPVLLDEHNEVGGRFNGGALPTTVIVDAQGEVRRRFVGARSLPVFEAMIAESRQPVKVASRSSSLKNSLE